MATPTVLTYVYIRAKWYAFPDNTSAREAATKYNGNIESLRSSKPIGVLIDDRTFIGRPRSFWPDVLGDAQGVTGDALVNPPVNPIHSSIPLTPDVPTTTTTMAQSPAGGGGWTSKAAEAASKAGSSASPKRKVYDFREYVERTPNLLVAFQNYKKTQDPTKIDKWERYGTPGERLGTGPTMSQKMGGANRDPNLQTGYTGGELNVEQFGNIHWDKFGKDEKRKLKGWKEVAGDDPGYVGRWDQYTV